MRYPMKKAANAPDEIKILINRAIHWVKFILDSAQCLDFSLQRHD